MAMESIPICERCGLRAVRHELEKRGTILRFCDYCYWGALEAEDAAKAEAAPAVQVPEKPGKAG